MCGNKYIPPGRSWRAWPRKSGALSRHLSRHGLSQADLDHRTESLLHSGDVRRLSTEDNGSGSIDPDFRGKLAPEAGLSRAN